jgi:hypothetical protein
LQAGQTIPGKLEISGMRFPAMVIPSIISTPQDMMQAFFSGIPASIRTKHLQRTLEFHDLNFGDLLL